MSQFYKINNKNVSCQHLANNILTNIKEKLELSVSND